MDEHDIDIAVIGAGVAGLACARALAIAGREVVVLESETMIATHTSSRNSEVIHAGLYYPEGSLKARFCVDGRRRLYDFLKARRIDFKQCGKLVVADASEAGDLEALLARAERNGVEQLSLIDGKAARDLEPALSPEIVAAMRSDVTGIFDSHAYFLALQGDLEDHGGAVAFGSPVERGEVQSNGVELQIGGDAPTRIRARTVVNAAGHNAPGIARRIDGPHIDEIPTARFAKGSYFTINGRTPFSRLIYPMPGRASLGLHLTVDISGRGKLGPDAEWLPEDAAPPFDYRVDPSLADKFYSAARRYWPDLPDGALSPDYSGVRPKLVGPGDPSGDFRIDRVPAGDGALVNLLGIESPGLTSSLAIAQHVASLAGEPACAA